VLRKPFEASALVSAVKPLAEAAGKDRESSQPANGVKLAAAPRPPAAPFIAVVDAEQVRAAITLALDAAMGTMVDEITRRVLATLNSSSKAEPRPAQQLAAAPVPTAEPAAASAAAAAAAPERATRIEPVRRVTPLRMRTGSILGIEFSPSETPETPEAPPIDAEPH